MQVIMFWLAGGLLIYTYFGYPLLIFAWAKLRPRRVATLSYEPPVSLVIVAHNESATIGAKIRNCLSLDYPRHLLNIVVASDGSTDDTATTIAQAYATQGVKVIAFTLRRGKAGIYNEVLRGLDGEIVVLADARQQIEASALCALLRPFADPHVGAVSGELVLKPRAAGGVGEGVGFYWRYEKFIRRNEAAVDSTVGATGALYAIRRALFEPIPDDTLLDDVLIPMRIVRRGYRVLFEGQARAYDGPPMTGRQEFQRKVRTIAGTFQFFVQEPWVLNPFRNRLWLQTVSHKGLRLFLPLIHAGLLVANLRLLDDNRFYIATLAVQVVFYLVALAGYLTRRSPHPSRLVSVPYVLCLMCWATVIGFVRFARGVQSTGWDPTRMTDFQVDHAARLPADSLLLK
jgi:cellulose synthase/poly-beta-1,6-N-acetylglucosamine synthase-like glycosyltransferase